MNTENGSIDDHVSILLKCYEISRTPIGIQKIKLVQGKIAYPGKFYKTYSIILLLVTCAVVKKAALKYFLRDIENYPIPLYFSQLVNIAILVFGFLAIFINGLYFSNKNYGKMFVFLMETTRDLNFNLAKRCRSFKIKLTIFHAIFLIFKISFYLPDIAQFKSLYSLSAHFIIYVSDLETIHFIIETNLIARLFENLNSKLTLFSKKKLSTKNGFLIKMWKTNYETDKIDTHQSGIFFKLIKTCISLFDIIDNINHSYAILVSIYLK